MSQSTEHLADAFRAALGDGRDPVRFTQWLAGVWDDQVAIIHTPPMANDGPIEGAKLGAGEVAIFSLMVKAIPDYRQENFWVKTDGPVIEFYEEIVGSLPDGAVCRAPIHYRFTVKDGRIAKVHGTFDLEALAPFNKVVADAGLRTPNG